MRTLTNYSSYDKHTISSWTKLDYQMAEFFVNTYQITWPNEQDYQYHGDYKPQVENSTLLDYNLLPLSETVWMDRAEIPNLAYKEFIFFISFDSTNYEAYIPQVEGERLAYGSEPMYFYFPATDISQAKADAYCRWRGAIISEWAKQDSWMGKTTWREGQYVRQFRGRLPTEEEWELAASGGVNTSQYPYGYMTLEESTPWQNSWVSYLSYHRQVPEAAITKALEAIPQASQVSLFHTAHAQVPEEALLPIPSYVYSHQPNTLGFYHMIGNVEEWISSPNTTKGSHHLDEAQPITDQNIYPAGTASPQIGFRCVCEEYLVSWEEIHQEYLELMNGQN